MVDITFNGITMEFSFVENKMDADIRQKLQIDLTEYTEQTLLDAYMIAHKQKFGKEFLQ